MVECCANASGQKASSACCGEEVQRKTDSYFELDEYTVSQAQEVVIQVDAMDCAGCASAVKEIVMSTPGILKCDASHLTSRLDIQFDVNATSIDTIIQNITQAGYRCSMTPDGSRKDDDAEQMRHSRCRAARNKFISSTPFSLAVIICTDVVPYFHWRTILSKQIIGNLAVGDCIVLALSSILLHYFSDAGSKLFRDIRTGRTSVNTLSSLGILLAFIYSSIIFLRRCFALDEQQETFFGTFAELSTFVLLGRWLEVLAIHYTTTTTSDILLKALPHSVKVHDKSGDRMVDVECLELDDVVVADPGMQFVADGIVVLGESEVDESVFSGACMPILREPGDDILAGTKNINARLLYKVLKTGEHTQIARLTRLIEEAHEGRARIQLFADHVASYFVPVILGLALATFVLWLRLDPSHYAWSQGYGSKFGSRWMNSVKMTIAVLVVSCPCALSVATPAAVMTGVRVGIENGLLIKDAAVLEEMQGITDVVFDKTGTLTQGRMIVDKVDLHERWSHGDALQLFWSLVLAAESALKDEHPIRKALVQHAATIVPDSSTRVTCLEVMAFPGQGLSCLTSSQNHNDTHQVLIGNESLLARFHFPVIPSAEARLCNSDHSGRTAIYVSIDGNYAGQILLHDSPKADAALTVQMLKDLKITSWILTGDSVSSAVPLAQRVGIEEGRVHAACTIKDKATIISSMRALGKHVIMVGDGVNDGPALLTANVGISISGASDLATESSDILLLRRDSLSDVVAAIHLAKAIYWRIKVNLFCAFAWTLVGISFAMGLFLPVGIHLPPAIAGFGMAFSCACITGSSLCLRRWKRPTSIMCEDERLDMAAEQKMPKWKWRWNRRETYIALDVV